MNKFVRWQGILGFILIIGLLLAITVIFLDTWIRMAVEGSAETATGAEVNVGSVSHTFSPLGITLNQIQLTDAAKPTHNSVQVASISADIELMPLLMSKVIINQLTATGVKFDQRRQNEGDVYRQPDESLTKSILPDDTKLPSVDEILANSPLKTTHAAEAAQSAYQRHSEVLQQKYQQLPDQDILKDYQARIKSLTETDYKNPVELAAAKEKFDTLKSELKQQQKQLKSFKQAVEEAKADLSPKLAALKAAPGQDYDLLKGLAAGEAGAYSDLTQAVFGDKAKAWSEALFAAYDIVAPMLASEKEQEIKHQRAEGRWIEFDDTQPLPGVLIRRADISINWQQQSVTSEWHDITNDHDKLGRPTTFKVDSNNNPLWQSLLVNGDFWIAESGIRAKQDWDLKGVKLNELSLADSGKLTTNMKSARLASRGQLSITDNVLNGRGVINLAELVMSADGSNKLTNIIADSLRQLTSLSIGAEIAGSINSPDFSIQSDLDNQLAKTLTANVSGEAKEKLDELKQRLNAKASGPLGESRQQLTQWLDWEKLADGNLDGIQDMLKTQLDSVVDKKKDELKDKLKDKLFGN